MLDQCIDTHIITVDNLSSDECEDLIKRLDICQEAKRQFMSLQISWQDYLDLIECAGVDISQFLHNADNNALIMGF
ncbi:MAG: hypothetical protein HEQ27_05285 [Dolichospermum sp. JUN01]|nr:hypothetical protein [Dolichospermum sp. JUN01]